ncbi:hypothetical protein VCSRO56_1314 [Vibrio cholerae]|nr:hypothetical protein VCSRO56_1314 [Vibrio cholerae]
MRHFPKRECAVGFPQPTAPLQDRLMVDFIHTLTHSGGCLFEIPTG